MPLVRSVTWAAMLAAVSLSNARIDTPTLASEGSLGGCAASRACGSGFWLGGRVLALRGGGKGRGATGGGGRWATNVIKLEPEESSEEKGLEGMETLTNAGIGTLEFGNILVDGRTVGMMYENCKDGDTAMLMSKDPVPTYDRRLGGKGDVYFEPEQTGKWKAVPVPEGRLGRKGKWKAVPVPEGMTKQQLYTKTIKEEKFMAKLSPEDKAHFMEQRQDLKSLTEASGNRVKDSRGVGKKLKKRKKEKERSRMRWEDRLDKQAEEKVARQKKREYNLANRKANKGKQTGGGYSQDGKQRPGKIRKTKMGGVRKQRRTGRHATFNKRRNRT